MKLFTLFLTGILPVVFTASTLLPKVAIAQSGTQISQANQSESGYKKQLDKLLRDGYTQLEAKNVSDAIIIYQQAQQFTHLQKNTFDESRILGILGRVYDFDGQYSASEKAYQEGIELLKNSLNTLDSSEQRFHDLRLQVSLFTGLGITYKKIGEFTKATEKLKLAISLSQSLEFSKAQQSYLEPRFELANVYKNDRKYKESIILYQECLALIRRTGDHEKEDIALTALGNAYLLMGDIKRAQESYALKTKSSGFSKSLSSQALKLSDASELDSINNTLSGLDALLQKTVPLLQKTSVELLRMYVLVSSDSRFDVIRKLGNTMANASQQINSMSIALRQGDIFSAFSFVQSLDDVMTQLTVYDKEMDILMKNVQNHPEDYKVLTPEVLRSMQEVSNNLNQLNQEFVGKSKKN